MNISNSAGALKRALKALIFLSDSDVEDPFRVDVDFGVEDYFDVGRFGVGSKDGVEEERRSRDVTVGSRRSEGSFSSLLCQEVC